MFGVSRLAVSLSEVPGLGFRDSGFRGSRFRVRGFVGSGFRVCGFAPWVMGLAFEVSPSGFGGFGFGVFEVRGFLFGFSMFQVPGLRDSVFRVRDFSRFLGSAFQGYWFAFLRFGFGFSVRGLAVNDFGCSGFRCLGFRVLRFRVRGFGFGV